MKMDLIKLLVCPQSGQQLKLDEPNYDNSEIESGWLSTEDNNYRYPIKNYIPRFVSATNYADNFGMQWNKFRLTQLDSYSGCEISHDRFFNATNWSAKQLKGKWVLDAGCGAGRFAEIALNAGAKVVALDYSSAVDACYANLGNHPNFHIVQGDIYTLPFRKKSFDFAYSLGVLQHTPHVKKAFFSLLPFISEDGYFCVDFYEKSWKSMLHLKYWLRPLTKRIPQDNLFEILQRLVPKMLPLSVSLGRVPVFGNAMQRMIPVANYVGRLPLNEKQQIEWSLLDTFDWLSPEFDYPQTAAIVENWFKEAGILNSEILKAGHLVGRGCVGR